MTIETTWLAPLFQVFDMPEALGFYRDALGFEVVSASPEVETPEGRFSHWMWLRLGPAHVMLNTAYDAGERPTTRDATRQQAHGDTALFFACPDVDATYAHLRARGVACDAPGVAPYGMKQLHLRDPDGYALCFQSPVQPSHDMRAERRQQDDPQGHADEPEQQAAR